MSENEGTGPLPDFESKGRHSKRVERRGIMTDLANQNEGRASTETLRKGVTFFVCTILVATVGYVLAGWGWVDAFYMVTITVFGVGYGEINPIESPWLKFFTIGVIFAGCSSLIYVIGGIIQMLAEGEIERMLGVRNRCREIGSLSDHTIICGYGRIGQMLATELSESGEDFLVLDCNPERVERAIHDGYLAMEGNCVRDESLQEAGIFRARVLATVLPDDADNVFITLTARGMSDAIRIIARAESPCTESKLIRSGANHVVIPAAIGAVRVAQLAISEMTDSDDLPENRYRMLTESCKRGVPVHEATPSQRSDVPSDISELAEIAADLSRSVVNRTVDKIIEHEQAVD